MKSNRSFSLDMEEARRRLEAWRKSRRRGKWIPAPLWALPATLARTHGVSLVSQRLGLDYNGLKLRAEATRTPRRSRLKPLLDSSNCASLGRLARLRAARWNWRGVREPG
jgi:hypothetical protein